MSIGRKLVLHLVLFPDLHVEKQDEFRIATVSAIRDDVPGMFGTGKHRGYKATDSDGRTYEKYWNLYPDDAMNPIDQWWCVEEGRYWYGVTQVRGLTGKPAWLEGEFATIVKWCPEHTTLYYDQCFDCYMNEKYPDREKPVQRRNIAKGW